MRNGELRKVNLYPSEKPYYIAKNGDLFNCFGKKLTANLSVGGYPRYTIRHGGIRKHYFVHRLVAEVFVAGKQDGLQVNHKDGNKLNCDYSNLEWVTPSENQMHSRYVLNNKTGFETRPIMCVETGKVYPSTNIAAQELKVNSSHLCECAQHKPYRKTAYGYHWEFV